MGQNGISLANVVWYLGLSEDWGFYPNLWHIFSGGKDDEWSTFWFFVPQENSATPRFFQFLNKRIWVFFLKKNQAYPDFAMGKVKLGSLLAVGSPTGEVRVLGTVCASMEEEGESWWTSVGFRVLPCFTMFYRVLTNIVGQSYISVSYVYNCMYIYIHTYTSLLETHVWSQLFRRRQLFAIFVACTGWGWAAGRIKRRKWLRGWSSYQRSNNQHTILGLVHGFGTWKCRKKNRQNMSYYGHWRM